MDNNEQSEASLSQTRQAAVTARTLQAGVPQQETRFRVCTGIRALPTSHPQSAESAHGAQDGPTLSSKRRVLATCPNVASTRAVAAPPAVALSLSDTSDHGGSAWPSRG